MAAGMPGYAALAILYSLLAATMLETLLRLWRVKDPPLAVRFRLGILAIPPVAPLLFDLLDPRRGTEPFRRQAALFDLRNWLGPDFDPSHPGWMLLLAAMAATTLLLAVLEANGLLRHSLGRRLADRPLSYLPDQLHDARASLASRGLPPPPIRAVDQPEPAAWTQGLFRPAVLTTTALVEMLDGEELEGVLAHEIAHVHGRHNWLSWLIYGLRLGSFYNPVALFTFHQISHDVERVCDAEAAAATGKPLALASALIKVHRATTRPLGKGYERARPPAWHAASLENRARQALVVDRVERLTHPEMAGAVSYPGLRLALALASVLAVAYLVV